PPRRRKESAGPPWHCPFGTGGRVPDGKPTRGSGGDLRTDARRAPDASARGGIITTPRDGPAACRTLRRIRQAGNPIRKALSEEYVAAGGPLSPRGKCSYTVGRDGARRGNAVLQPRR